MQAQSKRSKSAISLAPRGMSSPFFLSGYPLPSQALVVMADDRQGLADDAEVGQEFFGQRGVRSERGLPLRVQIL